MRGAPGAGLIPAATPARASAIVVNSTSDGVDADPGNGACTTSTGVCTLRATVMEANALAGPQEIELSAGTYLLSISGQDENGARTGDLDISDDLTISGADEGTTTVDGGSLDAIFQIFGPSQLTLEKLTLSNGTTTAVSVHGARLTPTSVTRRARPICPRCRPSIR